MSTDRYESAHHFLEQMDSGELDRSLSSEIKKLTREQLEELASILMERSDKARSGRERIN